MIHHIWTVSIAIIIASNSNGSRGGTKKALTWEDSLDVPGEDEVDGSINQHHPDTGFQVEGVVRHWTFTNVLPLRAYRLLLITSDVRTAKPKGNVGRQALETDELPIAFICVGSAWVTPIL